jgi:hypothetical protein
MTLIEVLAGLVVLGTLLAAVTVARGRFLRQWSEADRRVQATRAVDALLSAWLSAPAEAVPLDAQGPLDGVPGHVWRTRRMHDAAANALGALVVRLDVIGPAAAGREPLLTVDFLLQQPRRPAATQAARGEP